MSEYREQDIERLLAKEPPPVPEGLAERIESEIPDRLGEARRPWGRFLRAAAIVVVLVGAGVLAASLLGRKDVPEQASVLQQPSEPVETSRSPVAVDTPAPETPTAQDTMAAAEPTASWTPESTPTPVPARVVKARPESTPSPELHEGRLEVKVVDSTGLPLPGVVVVLTQYAIQTADKAISDAWGVAEFLSLTPGKYSVRAELMGFSPTVRQNIGIGPGQAESVDVELQPGGVMETCVVTSSGPVIGTSNSTSSTGFAAPYLPSTGGSAEPNDRRHGDTFFQSYGVNPFIDTEDDNLSTFGLDVDTASYSVARSYLREGGLPPPEAIRVEEFLNSFDYGDEPPRSQDFAIRSEAAPTPFGEGRRYQTVRIHIQARDVESVDRKPARLTFVVDVSGSMSIESRLGLVKRALRLLLASLRPDDSVGLVVFGSTARVVLEPTGDLDAIVAAIEGLHAEGSTNAEEGLTLGYGMASDAFLEGGINRVVLCSDGVANVGRTGADSILERIEREAARGIELTTVGFGMDNYNDILMEQLADKGNGRYAYVDTFDEARRLFVEELTATLETVAREARVQVEWNPAVVARYRLLGYENRDIEDERFRDDTVDAGEIGAGHGVTALYEIKLHPDANPWRRLGTLRLRWQPVDGDGGFTEMEHKLRFRDLARTWEEASAAMRLATLVAEFAELLKGSYWAKNGSLEDVLYLAGDLPAEAGDERVAELVELLATAVDLSGTDEAGNRTLTSP